MMRAHNLGLGGRFSNAIVIDLTYGCFESRKVRYPDEFVHTKSWIQWRLTIVGHPIIGAFEGYKIPGHAINNALLRVPFGKD